MDLKVLADTEANVACLLPIGKEQDSGRRRDLQSPRDRAGHKFRSLPVPSNLFRPLSLAQKTQNRLVCPGEGILGLCKVFPLS